MAARNSRTGGGRRPQKSLSINKDQGDLLESLKNLWQESTGQETDWGSFLAAAVLVGLGVYGLQKVAEMVQKSEQSAQVECPACRRTFAMAIPVNSPYAIPLPCPICGENVVVYRGLVRPGSPA